MTRANGLGWFFTGLALIGAAELTWAADVPSRANGNLPAFSDEREAAALHFVKKHAPDLLPLLDKLKTSDAKRYQGEICEIFQVTEWLTDLKDEDFKRFSLELDIWKAETNSLILVARLANLSEAERGRYKDELETHAKRLVDLDLQTAKLRVEQLERELVEARDVLLKGEEKRDAMLKERFDKLLDQAKRKGMMK